LRSSKAITRSRGPFYIEGAEPGDTLVVHILDLQVDGKQGVGTFSPGFGAINATHSRPMLEKEALPEQIWFYPIDHADRQPTFQALDSNYKVKIPLHPFLGCIGVAPANGEARSSIVPAEFGGKWTLRKSPLETHSISVNVAGAVYFGTATRHGHGEMPAVPSKIECVSNGDFRSVMLPPNFRRHDGAARLAIGWRDADATKKGCSGIFTL